MKLLITGARGFVGSHLTFELMARGHHVFAGSQHTIGMHNEIEFLSFDIKNIEQVKKAIKQSMPDCVIHLAAVSMVALSWDNPIHTFDVNVKGTLNLVEAIHNIKPDTKLLIVGSGQEYGATAGKGVPLTEEDQCIPQNPYAFSKYTSGQMALLLGDKYNLSIVHARPFNHFGPGQQEGFLISDISAQIAKIEKSIIDPIIYAGNIEVHRDFIDVRDVVKAYIHLIEKNVNNGVYNICSGTAYPIHKLIEKLVGFSNKKIELRIKKERLRKQELSVIVGSPEKLKIATGWKPQHRIEDSLYDTLNWWRGINEQGHFSV